MPTVAGWGIKTRSKKASGGTRGGVKSAADYIEDEEKTTMDETEYQAKKQAVTSSKKVNLEESDRDIELVSGDGVANAIGYMNNPNKTVSGKRQFVSGVNCDPKTAVDEFQFYNDKYHQMCQEHLAAGARANEAIHFYQSFKGNNLDPDEVHRMGVEFAQRVCGGSYQALVTTHLNTGNYHNHILFSAYSIDEKNGRPYKWHQTFDRVKELRAISDEIAQEHGIPIIMNQDGRGSTYHEWMAIQSGNSWKEQLRIDIENTKEVSRNWDEFTRYMQAAGYTITPNRRSNTYTMPGSDLKVNDSTLGKAYTKAALEQYWDSKIEKEAAQDLQNSRDEADRIQRKKTFEQEIRVSRYTSLGRRRSDLEMLLIFALKIIKAVLELFADPEGKRLFPDNPVHQKPDWKAKAMLETLRIVREENIETIEQLDARLNAAGAQLSHLVAVNNKDYADLGAMEETVKVAEEGIHLMEYLQTLGITLADLPIAKVPEEESRYAAALQCPMDKHQSQKLHQLLEENPSFHLKYKYGETTTFDAARIIKFLSSPETETKPDTVLNDEEWQRERLVKKYEKRREETNERMLQKNPGPITPQQISMLERLAKHPNYAAKLRKIDLNSLTKYDAIKIINFLTMQNPLQIPKATDEQRQQIADLLKGRGEQLHKPIDALNDTEAKAVIAYLNGKSSRMPEVLQEMESIRETDIKQINELLSIHPDIAAPESFDGWSHSDGTRFVAYLMEYQNPPEQLQEVIAGDVTALLEGRSLDDQEAIMMALNVFTSLANIGLDSIEKAQLYLQDYRMKEANLEANAALYMETKDEYRKLKRVAYNVNLAQNPKFVYGPKFEEDTPEVDIQQVVQYLEENNPTAIDTELEAEIQREEDEHKGEDYTQEDQYFESKNREETIR